MSAELHAELSKSHRKLAISIGRNTVFGVIARVAQVTTRLVTVPMVIAHLGLDGYGIWSIIMTASAYMRFGSVGIKSAFQKYVAEATGNGNFERTNKLLSTGSAIMLVLSIIGLIPSALFSKKLAAAAGVPAEFLTAAGASIAVLAVIMLLSNVAAAFEAIVMGGHRIDLVRKFATFFTIAEAVGIVILLHYGHGLFAMACVMAVSELGYLGCCYVAARKLLPQIQVSRRYVTVSELPELVRFAGSYQLVNILEVVYVAILPITILREFGAAASGVYAIVQRLAGSAAMLPDSFLHPILSGGSMVYASGSEESMRKLIQKSYKITLGLSLFPLAFLAVFGNSLVYAWTGQVDPKLRQTLALVCLTILFAGFSMLGLVLYRVSGRALLDNVRQLLRIATLLGIALLSKKIGFYGVLAGWAAAELVGMLFMIFALAKTFTAFRVRDLLPDTAKLFLTTAAMILAGIVGLHLPTPALENTRLAALVAVAKAGLGCLLVAWPALFVTKAVTGAESRALAGVFLPRRNREEYSTEGLSK